VLLWAGCIAGALDENDNRMKLVAAGFGAIGIEPRRIYDVEDAREFLAGKGIDLDAIAPQIEGKFRSAFVRATKPRARPQATARACCA
jgi:arsenite methyltransferase